MKGRLKVKSKVWLEKDGELVFGTGKAAILSHIEKTGSINSAAKALNMSYRHAWSYIRCAEKRLGHDLLIKTKGGKSGGGAVLTDHAKGLLVKFEALDRLSRAYTNECYKKIFRK